MARNKSTPRSEAERVSELDARARLRDYAVEERRRLAAFGITPVSTDTSRAARDEEPDEMDYYAVPRGTTVITNKRARPRHPIGASGGFTLMARLQVEDILNKAEVRKSAVTLSVLLHLASVMDYGGRIAPEHCSSAAISKRLGWAPQKVAAALRLLWSLDVVRPVEAAPVPRFWAVNPLFACRGRAEHHTKQVGDYQSLVLATGTSPRQVIRPPAAPRPARPPHPQGSAR
ncbi:MAG: hypothetical protein ACK53A_05285 [Gemmatimonadota bacterium]